MDFSRLVRNNQNYKSLKFIVHSKRRQSSVPLSNELKVKDCTGDPKISKKTISLLERISLVDFGNEEGVKRLEAAIRFAKLLKTYHIDESVKPMYSVLEREKLRLREDKVNEGDCREKILKNAAVVDEYYFVAPPGNIPKE
ncbi:glutamyl-tRNA(Gln) amidotransferase subunit C, mitochondrial [Cephus cinctus]|uniref:Glutamyl-tRNA(Gln) amidotransferase subunit C, mitochondrial n=1 Tax=Cephus cinctus TaxID=211228 RepID=A0AAJ7BLI7_CEPCN|nr:glutamyl-tRNA(Gln) amidotransferase subunit C, mitochondrial [Cephus cinctus]